jgi:hypothetical protein
MALSGELAAITKQHVHIEFHERRTSSDAGTFESDMVFVCHPVKEVWQTPELLYHTPQL